MEQISTTPRRGRRSKGRLYKRTKDGKEHPLKSRVHGVFWLQYSVNGKRVRQKLTHPDGTPITDGDEAEMERARIMAPFTTADEVERLQAIQARLAAAKEEQAQAEREREPPLGLVEAWDAYVDSDVRPDSGEVTLADYERHYRKFREWVVQSHTDVEHVAQVSPKMAKEYAKSLGRDVSPNTFNKRIGFLKLFFRVLCEERRVARDAALGELPFEKIKRRKIKSNSRRELTVEQIYKLLSSADGELALLLGLGYFTGLRRGDCCTLLWSEVDLVRGLIKRVPNKIRDRSENPDPVKVGIAPPLHEALSRIPPGKRQGYVLPRMAKLYNDPGRRDRISRMINSHFTKCGIRTQREGTGRYRDPETKKVVNTGRRAITDYGFHSLRYSYISHHAEAGTPQAVIQANAGHKNPAMTEHYTRISDERAREVAAVLTLPSADDLGQVGRNAGPLGANEGERERLPDWARDLAEQLNGSNWRHVREALLGGLAAHD